METSCTHGLSGMARRAIGCCVWRLTLVAKFFLLAVAFLSLPSSEVRAGYVYDIDLTGWEIYGDFTSPRNSRIEVELFPYATISKVEWIDLEFSSENGSFADEFVISVNDSSQSYLPETFWENKPYTGTEKTDSYSGSGSFATPGIFDSGPFRLLSDGILIVYIYDEFDDFGSDAGNIRDAVVSRGTLRITAVPEPSSLVMLGTTAAFASTVIRRKRRRQRPSSQFNV